MKRWGTINLSYLCCCSSDKMISGSCGGDLNSLCERNNVHIKPRISETWAKLEFNGFDIGSCKRDENPGWWLVHEPCWFALIFSPPSSIVARNTKGELREHVRTGTGQWINCSIRCQPRLELNRIDCAGKCCKHRDLLLKRQ